MLHFHGISPLHVSQSLSTCRSKKNSVAVSYRTITCAKHRNWYKDTKFLAETMKNRETWLDHERIASTTVNSRGNLSKSERA